MLHEKELYLLKEAERRILHMIDTIDHAGSVEDALIVSTQHFETLLAALRNREGFRNTVKTLQPVVLAVGQASALIR